MDGLSFSPFINESVIEDGSGSGFSDYIDYSDFLRHVNHFNFSHLLNTSDHDRLLTLIRENVDPSYWCDKKLALELPNNLTWNASARCNSSSTSVGSVINSFWEAGKVRIPLYR